MSPDAGNPDAASRLLDALADPATYPHAPKTVAIVQTHVSIVALADDLVFKLKKPVRLPFLDFSTREARRATCRDEVRLNRRLCRDTYLGIAVLRRDAKALRFAPTLDDEGPDDGTPARDDEVDFAVVMRRLPADRMLDVQLRNGTATTTAIETLARTVAAFHRQADRHEQVRELGAPEHLVRLAADNFAELRAMPGHGLPDELLLATESASARAFARILPTLRERAASGHVIDGHGDLHARNVCMTEPPTIYDCLEFSAGLRCGDTATEIAFLAMDLRHRGAAHLADRFVAAYVAAMDDAQLPSLLLPLVAYRAMVRCKVAAIAASEPELPTPDRAGARASSAAHLRLAAVALFESAGPHWLVLCGPPGSGKSTLAARLHTISAWPVIATDVLRKELASLPPTARAGPEHYTDEFSQRTYAELVARATHATETGARCVLLDGNFATPERRRLAAEAARIAGATAVLVHVAVDRATSLARVTLRATDPQRASDAGPAEHAALWDRFVAPTASEGIAIACVDAGEPGIAPDPTSHSAAAPHDADHTTDGLLAAMLAEGLQRTATSPDG